MPDIPAAMRDHLKAVPEGLWSFFLPQLLQLGAQTFSVPYGIAAHLDGAIAAGWFWACPIDDDCLITTMHMTTRRSFVLLEIPEVDYLVLGILSSSDTGLVNDMRETLGVTGDPSDPFAGGFSPTLERNILAFPMVHGLREFEMPTGSLHDSCNICMLPSFVERAQEALGSTTPRLAETLAAGLELNGSDRLQAVMRALSPQDALRAGAPLHYRALVYEALAETISYLREESADDMPLDLHGRRHVAETVNAILLTSLANPPTLDELAERLFMGRTRLCQAFREETGMSIGEQLTALRMSEARRRLEQSEESIAVIAHSLGFRHASSFSTMFLRQTGMSPSAWRAARARG